MKLKPCPKCKSRSAKLEQFPILLLGGTRKRWFINCRDCGFRIGPYIEPEEAVLRWRMPRSSKSSPHKTSKDTSRV